MMGNFNNIIAIKREPFRHVNAFQTYSPHTQYLILEQLHNVSEIIKINCIKEYMYM